MAQKLDTSGKNYDNDPVVERAWAENAMKHAEAYMKLIKAVKDLKTLNLTKIDDELYKSFREQFPDLKVESFKEDDIKSEGAKAKWRKILPSFENRVKDWNMGTLLRLRSDSDLGPDNSCIVVRTIFYAIEIARNREGHNSNLNF